MTCRHVRHSGTIRVGAPAGQVFPLFTAPGERLWVPGWHPRILHGGDGREPGAVFITGSGDERTVWVVVDFDPRQRHARYARVAPDSRAGTVEIRVRQEGGGSVVEVTYELTALCERGNAVLEEFDDDAFLAMLRDWERRISEAGIDFERIEELL